MGSTTDQNDGSGNLIASAASTTNDLHSLGQNAHRLDIQTMPGDADYQIRSTDRYVVTSVAFSANRTWTLPAAKAVPAGWEITIADAAGIVPFPGPHSLTVATSGADLINTAASVAFGSEPYSFLVVRSNGVALWQILGISPIDAFSVGYDARLQNLTVGNYFSTFQRSLTLADGQNDNVATAATYVRVVGPANPFSISGFVLPTIANAGGRGTQLIVQNTTAQTMTLLHYNSGSANINRIVTPAAADLALAGPGTVTLIYDMVDGYWIPLSTLHA